MTALNIVPDRVEMVPLNTATSPPTTPPRILRARIEAAAVHVSDRYADGHIEVEQYNAYPGLDTDAAHRR